MGSVIVVDDDATNRELLRTLLVHRGHRVTEAADGAAALALARVDPPDLIITDVLMPTMDGYELVRRLRAEPTLADTHVVFFSAHYVEREARSLAASCGVDEILAKPSEPEDILKVVDRILAGERSAIRAPARSADELDREHLRVLTDKLAEKVAELEQVNARLAEVIALGQRLGQEHDPVRLVEEFCGAARRIIGSRYALVAVVDADDGAFRHVFGSGLPAAVAAALVGQGAHRGRLGGLLGQAGTSRGRGGSAPAAELGLPAGHPDFATYLAAPIASLTRRYGWICLTGKLGLADFTAEDEKLAEVLAAQLGRIYENGRLYRDVERQRKVAAALARVARDLIGLSTTTAVLERLCALTTEALACNACFALLWDRDHRLLVPTAAHGHGSSDWESIRSVEIPDAIFGTALARLGRGVPVEVAADEIAASELASLARRFSIARVLLAPLHRQGEMVGILAAVLEDPAELFNASTHAIVPEVTRLASLALENAWLVEQLGSASRLKSEFVASMSHELRTPLHVILGYGELLRDGAFGELDPRQQEALERIRRNGTQLLALIDATLDVGRLEMGLLPIRREEVSLAELAAEVEAESAGRRADLALGFDVPADLPPLWTDRVKLKSVLKNLVDNALKFTERGSIALTARPLDDGVEVTVSDTGPGIPAEAFEVVFEAFRQLESGDARPHGGVGLGLYIVRRFADLLGGEVSVQSTVGEGSVFRLWFPFVAPAVADQRASG